MVCHAWPCSAKNHALLTERFVHAYPVSSGTCLRASHVLMHCCSSVCVCVCACVSSQVDFLPSEDLSEEERQKLIEAQQAAAASTRNVHTVIDGQERTFQVGCRTTWPPSHLSHVHPAYWHVDAACIAGHVCVCVCVCVSQLRSSNVVQTRGGYMMDVVVTLDNRETQHRIIVGKRRAVHANARMSGVT